MPIRSSHRLLLAAFVILAASGALVSPPRAAADGPREIETVTTTLYPGWNLVGWVGPDTTTSRLFVKIPALQQVWAWDTEGQTYRHAQRNRYRDLPELTNGMGLWLLLRGPTPIEWGQEVSPYGVAVHLREGVNLVAVASDGGVRLPGADHRVAWRWDPVRQRFEHYRFGDTKVRRGDALSVEMGAPINWWQTGTPDQTLVFTPSVPSETRSTILAEHERVRVFLAERFGIVTPGPIQHISADAEELQAVYREVRGIEWAGGVCARGDGGRTYFRVLRCTYPSGSRSMVSEFIANLLRQLPAGIPGRPGTLPVEMRGPQWLLDGIDWYVTHADLEAQGAWDEGDRRWMNGLARRLVLPLRFFENRILPRGIVVYHGEQTSLVTLAVDLLTQIAGEPALVDYLFELRTSDWRTAFAAAFGMDVEQFYLSFAAHRAESFPPLPHLVDDLHEPVLVVAESIPASTAAALRAEFEGVRDFYLDRFGVEASEFTMYLAADSDEAFALAPGWHGRRECSNAPARGLVVYTLDWCRNAPDLQYPYFSAIRSELAYTQPLPPSGSVDGWAPAWFDWGAEQYARVRYAQDTRGEPEHRFRDNARLAAWSNPIPLEGIETYRDTIMVGSEFASSIGFLALEWLTDHTGDPAIFDYYRRLPEAASRGEAFEGAFGLTFEEFYEQFEAYRATLRTP